MIQIREVKSHSPDKTLYGDAVSPELLESIGLTKDSVILFGHQHVQTCRGFAEEDAKVSRIPLTVSQPIEPPRMVPNLNQKLMLPETSKVSKVRTLGEI